MSEGSTSKSTHRIGLIGFGEAGSILGGDLAALGARVACYDILLDRAETRGALCAKAEAVNVRPVNDLNELLHQSDLVISAVTATAAEQVARDSASGLRPGQIFMDINSVSPATKQANARAVEASGAAYVEAAVMAPVPPQRLKTPMLLGGRQAQALAETLAEFGMHATAIGEEIGTASAIKMCRSIMIKGIEALTTECLFAARRFGAEQAVLASLDKTFPGMGWLDAQPDCLISRVAEHGRRRAAEMREVAKTLRDIGIEPLMASATAERQQDTVERMADKRLRYQDLEPFSWRVLADRLRAR